MSYCRWSSDDFQCDVYVYEDVGGGWTTHVAGNRIAGKLTPVGPFPEDKADMGAWFERHNTQMAELEKMERKPIGLPHDGESFNDPTPGECADRLESLRALGYNVPQYAIDNLREEQEEVE